MTAVERFGLLLLLFSVLSVAGIARLRERAFWPVPALIAMALLGQRLRWGGSPAQSLVLVLVACTWLTGAILYVRALRRAKRRA